MSLDSGRNMERRNDTEERYVRTRNGQAQEEARRNFSPQKRDNKCRYVDEYRGQRQERNNLNYQRKGGLSPLRSPLRPENKEEMSHSASNNDRRHIRPRYHSQNERRMKTPEKAAPFSPRFDRYTPESGSLRSGSVKIHDWGEEMDRQDEEDEENNRYRRKLEMNKERKNSADESSKHESDATLLARRQKDIDYGKNTQGYARYVKLVPSFKRRKGDPCTPLKYVKVSRRSWDQQVKNWRRRLHRYDPPQAKKQELDTSFDTAFTELSSDCESWDSGSTASEIALADDDVPISTVEENRCLSNNAMELSDSDAITTCGRKETGFPSLPSRLSHHDTSQNKSLDPIATAQIEMKKSFTSYADATTMSAPPNNNNNNQQSLTETDSIDNMNDNVTPRNDDFFAKFDLDGGIF